MKRHVIKEKIEEIWEECQKRNIGSNEAELDFIESITDWIMERDNAPIASKLSGKSVLILGDGNAERLKFLLDEHKDILVSSPEDLEINRNDIIKNIELTPPPLIDPYESFEEQKHSPIYTPKRKKFKRR